MASRRRNLFVLLLVLGLLAASAAVILTKPTQLGLDLQGGVGLVYEGEPTPQSQVTPDALERSIEIIRRRVDKLGVAEPEIQRSGSDQITVNMPAIKDAQRAIRQVGSTAQLYFYDWEGNVIPKPGPGTNASPITGVYRAVKKASREKPRRQDLGMATVSGPQYYLFDRHRKLLAGPDTSRKDLLADFGGKQPRSSSILTVPRGVLVIAARQTTGEKRPSNQYYLIWDRPELRGTEIRRPRQEFDPTTSEPIVTFRFTSKGRRAFHNVTRRLAQRGQQNYIPGQNPQAFYQTFAVVLDRELITNPFIDFNQNPDGIDGRTGAQISGGFTIQSAQDLANNLAIGALPINLKLVSQTQISATLGKEALRQGMIAAVIGLIMVMLFLIAFYRLLGVVADTALLIYATIFFAFIKLIPITLTLPGIAGLVLTIGVAADANIVIFERIKEELRAGRSIAAGIAAGYKKGFRTILDANVVIISVAFILFVLATAGVKGFAFVLGVGTLVSMFTAVVATQAILGTIGNYSFMRKPSMLGATRQHVRWHFDFMGASKWLFSLSGIILATGAVSWGLQGINAGLDFKGGGRVTASLKQPVTEAKVRGALAPLGLADAKVQRVTSKKLGANVFRVESKQLQKPHEVRDVLNKRFGIETGGFSSESVGPTFGQQVKRSAIIAIIFSLLAIVAYISFRFELKFAIPAIIALLHDILITFGVFSLVGREVTTSTIAALLTILGYSLYDTVIVFDRVRENMPRMPRAAFSQIVNRSMSEVMTRSINTSLSTLMPVVILFIFGGETLKDFAFALIVGIISGAYSSIFIASPVLCRWKEREEGFVRRSVRIREEFGGVIPAFAAVGGAPTKGAGMAVPIDGPTRRRPASGDGAPPARDDDAGRLKRKTAEASAKVEVERPPEIETERPAETPAGTGTASRTASTPFRPTKKKRKKDRAKRRRSRKKHGRR